MQGSTVRLWAFGAAAIFVAQAVACTNAEETTPAKAAPPSEVDSSADPLDRGWRAFIEGLEAGREEVRHPWLQGPAPEGRDLAEGYRYLLGHLVRIAEFEAIQHADVPYFQRYVRMMSKWTIDNPDTLYLGAPIDPSGRYRVEGRVADTREWRTGERADVFPKAPRVVTFQTTTAQVGQTGSLAEFATCRNQTLGAVRHFQIEPDAEGRFEILIAAERPADYEGLFLPTRAAMRCRDREGNTVTREREATSLNVREIFSDWDRERALELEIVRVDGPTRQRPPTDPEAMGEVLTQIGAQVPNQIRFWNRLHEQGLEVLDDRNGDGRQSLPLNGINPPSPPFIAGGTAGAGQLYAAGTYQLEEDQALIVRVEAPHEPYYLGFQLANLWGESLDQASYVSSRTGGQLPVASDGARYYVVAHRDPGVLGWVDTTGIRHGTISMRFIYEHTPEGEALPSATARLVGVDEVRSLLPQDTPQIDRAARLEEIARRQSHIRRRFRQY